MGQVNTYVISIAVILTLSSAFILLGAQFGGEKGQYDVVRDYAVDLVDQYGAVTPEVLNKIQQQVNETGLDYNRFDFSGSTTSPVPLFGVARLEIKYLSVIKNKPIEQYDVYPETLYHDVIYVTRTGR